MNIVEAEAVEEGACDRGVDVIGWRSPARAKQPRMHLLKPVSLYWSLSAHHHAAIEALFSLTSISGSFSCYHV